MSEENVLNLQQKPSERDGETDGTTIEGQRSAGHHASTVDNAEVNASLEQDLTSGIEHSIGQNIGQIIGEGLSPVRAGIASLEEALRTVTEQLDRFGEVEMDRQVSQMAGTIRRLLDENTARSGDRYARQLEAERSRWQRELEDQLNEVRSRADEELAAWRAGEIELKGRQVELEKQLAASREALSLAVRSTGNQPGPRTSAPVAESNQLKVAVNDINSQRSQADTLTALIRNASHFASRIAFFVVRSGAANGWKADGFSNGLDDGSVKGLAIPVDNGSLIGRALTSFITVESIDPHAELPPVLGQFAAPHPSRALAVPLVVRGRAAAVLYADSGVEGDGRLNRAALEVIMEVGAMGIELLPTRRSDPTPAVSRGTIPLPRREETTAKEVAMDSAQAPTPSLVEPKPLFTPPVYDDQVTPGTINEGESTDPHQRTAFGRPSDSWRPDSTENGSTSDSGEFDADEVEPSITRGVQRTDEIDGWQKTSGDRFSTPTLDDRLPNSTGPEMTTIIPDDGGSTVIEPPFLTPSTGTSDQVETTGRVTKPVPDQTARPSTPFLTDTRTPSITSGSSTESEHRAHNDARRFARLLVSEIKLYNGSKVNEGRRNSDLYSRLSDEIVRSRKVYEKRVSPAVSARFDYFYDELVQTLAEGDKEKLGSDCPGPVINQEPG